MKNLYVPGKGKNMTTKINSLNIDLEQPYLYKGEILKINLGVLSYKHIVIYITNILELSEPVDEIKTFLKNEMDKRKIKFLHCDILSESTYLGEVNEFGKMRRFFKSYRDNLSAEDRLYLELSE